jgi:hypothetical protein
MGGEGDEPRHRRQPVGVERGLELHRLDEDEANTTRDEAKLEARVKLGAMTLNEMRENLGLDLYVNPAANKPMALANAGFVPIEANVGGETVEWNFRTTFQTNQTNKGPCASRITE